MNWLKNILMEEVEEQQDANAAPTIFESPKKVEKLILKKETKPALASTSTSKSKLKTEEVRIEAEKKVSKESKDSELNRDMWKTLEEASQMYGITTALMAKHIKSAITDDALDEKALVIEAKDKIISDKKPNPKTKSNLYYIGLIISVGFRIKGEKGKKFREIATQIMLSNYLNH